MVRAAVRGANGLRPSLVRRTLLRTVVEQRQVPSRAALAAATGVSRAAVSVAVDRLLDAGLVQELDPLPALGAGRPGVPIVPARGTVAGIGLEINVDYLGVRAVDLAGEVLAEQVVFGDLRDAEPTQVADAMAGAVAPVLAGLADRGVLTVGATVAVPGLVDAGAGILRSAPYLGWTDIDLAAMLRLALPGIEPVLVNEAHVAAQAELRVRRPDASFVYLSGEPGVTGAVVLHGTVLDGVHGWAGDVGQVLVDPSRGANGTLERLVGTDALLRSAKLDASVGILGLLAEVEAGRGDAADVVRRAGVLLGVGLSSVVGLVDVQSVIIGGALWPLAVHLAGPVVEQLRFRVQAGPWADFQVSPAAAGDLPALTGAAWSSLQRVVDDPDSFIPS